MVRASGGCKKYAQSKPGGGAQTEKIQKAKPAHEEFIAKLSTLSTFRFSNKESRSNAVCFGSDCQNSALVVQSASAFGC